MSAEQTRRVLELNMPLPLDRIFEQIDLRQCLGSATISQVSQTLDALRLHLINAERRNPYDHRQSRMCTCLSLQ